MSEEKLIEVSWVVEERGMFTSALLPKKKFEEFVGRNIQPWVSKKEKIMDEDVFKDE